MCRKADPKKINFHDYCLDPKIICTEKCCEWCWGYFLVRIFFENATKMTISCRCASDRPNGYSGTDFGRSIKLFLSTVLVLIL